MSELDALRDFRLAPLNSRRDMAMLGVLHKFNLGLAPPQLAAFFHRIGAVEEHPLRCKLRLWQKLHDEQLATPVDFSSSKLLKRSLFGLARCYNTLPQNIVDCKSVRGLQRELQAGLLRFAELGVDNWQVLFSTGWKSLPRTKFDSVLA